MLLNVTNTIRPNVYNPNYISRQQTPQNQENRRNIKYTNSLQVSDTVSFGGQGGSKVGKIALYVLAAIGVVATSLGLQQIDENTAKRRLPNLREKIILEAGPGKLKEFDSVYNANNDPKNLTRKYANLYYDFMDYIQKRYSNIKDTIGSTDMTDMGTQIEELIEKYIEESKVKNREILDSLKNDSLNINTITFLKGYTLK